MQTSEMFDVGKVLKMSLFPTACDFFAQMMDDEVLSLFSEVACCNLACPSRLDGPQATST